MERKNECGDPAFNKKYVLSIVSTPEDLMDAIFTYKKNLFSTTNK